MMRSDIVNAIYRERDRQERLHPGTTCATPGRNSDACLRTLTEELGEVADVLGLAEETLTVDGTWQPEIVLKLRTELVHVAACAFAWLEVLDAPSDWSDIPRHRCVVAPIIPRYEFKAEGADQSWIGRDAFIDSAGALFVNGAQRESRTAMVWAGKVSEVNEAQGTVVVPIQRGFIEVAMPSDGVPDGVIR